MTVSIIIAVKTWQRNLEECVAKCAELDFKDFEIIVLPDKPHELRGWFKELPIRVIPTGAVSPAVKRDIGNKYAKGNIIAYIDDDAWPVKDWLTHALMYFQDDTIAAVCGPAVTPADDSILQKASGAVYASVLTSGKYIYRYLAKNTRFVDDYPSCNFIVRKSVLDELGGFDTNFWPGEDTKLCLEITKKLNKQIVYDPQVLVFHHRRKLFLPHLKQIASYALHRGYFVKRFPETSFRLAYFLPSIFTIGLIFGFFAGMLAPWVRAIYQYTILFYIILVLISSLSNGLRLACWVFLGIIFTHITYGIFFLKGLFTSKLSEEKEL